MPTPPSTLPNWATSPGDPGDVSAPPAATQAAGWQGGFKPPHEWVNWWWNLVGQWVLFVSQSAQVFNDLDDAVDYADANLSADDMLVVFENDNDTGPGTEEEEEDTGATGPFGGLDTYQGLVVFAVGTGEPYGVNRDLEGASGTPTPQVEYTRTESSTAQNYVIKSDGRYTVVAYGTWVECFNATTGASVWVFDMDTIPVADIAISGDAVYIVHGISTGLGDTVANRHMHKLNLLTKAVLWSLQHSPAGDELRSVCTNGRQVFVSGTASGYASGATTRAIVASNGYDATGECNNGTDASGLAWDRVDAVVAGSGRVMDCDGTTLFFGNSSLASLQLEWIGQADGRTVFGIAHPDSSISAAHVSCDQDYVYMSGSDGGSPSEGFVEAYHKRTGVLAWRWASTGGTAAYTAAIAAVSDGCKLFVLGDSEAKIWRVSRGNVPTRFRVVDPANELVRYRNWKLQPEVQ